MKKFGKMIILMCVCLLSLFVPLPLHADEGPGTLTITGAIVGQEYSIYEMLSLDSYNETNQAYTYKIVNEWKSFFTDDLVAKNVVTLDSDGYVKAIDDGQDMEAFATNAKTYLKNNSGTISAVATKTATTTTVVFENIPSGYYLVDSSLGTICSTVNVAPSGTIIEKNAVPVLTNTVFKSTDNKTPADYAIAGTNVPRFAVMISDFKGAENFVIHLSGDKLEIDKDMISVNTNGTITPQLNTGTPINPSNYTISESPEDGCDYHISFNQSYLDSLASDTNILVAYKAALVQDGSVVAGTKNTASAYLTYGDALHASRTQTANAYVYTFDLTITKIGDGISTNYLQGAEFVLLNKIQSAVAVIDNGMVIGWEAIPASFESKHILRTGSDGKCHVVGLQDTTFYLQEIKAPAGYNRLYDPVEITITSDILTVTTDPETMVTTETYTAPVKTIDNHKGALMPETGGVGTIGIISLGLVMATVGIALLKKTEKDQ